MSVPSARKVDGGSGPGIPDSKLRVWCDLAWGHALVWFATFGRWSTPIHRARVEARLTRTLLPGVHLYFADCYLRLAELYEREGETELTPRVMALRDKAAIHLAAAGPLPDGTPPSEAATAMGIPWEPELVDARALLAPSVPTPFPRGVTPVGSPAPS
jgi:hypothetical protein